MTDWLSWRCYISISPNIIHPDILTMIMPSNFLDSKAHGSITKWGKLSKNKNLMGVWTRFKVRRWGWGVQGQVQKKVEGWVQSCIFFRSSLRKMAIEILNCRRLANIVNSMSTQKNWIWIRSWMSFFDSIQFIVPYYRHIYCVISIMVLSRSEDLSILNMALKYLAK